MPWPAVAAASVVTSQMPAIWTLRRVAVAARSSISAYRS
jgi:hypothetical protein